MCASITHVRAVLYARQSLDKAGTGLAVARQLAEDERLCELRGYEVVARESDNDMSGYSGKARPGYERVIALMRSGAVDVVVVWAVDRLTRRLADLIALIDLCEQTGVRVATVSGDLDLSTPSGKLVARLLGSVAQGEVETKSARQQLAERQAAQAGKPRLGTPRPFGWQPDRVALDEAEAAAVADACTVLLCGGTITGVCRDWEARGLRPHQAPFGPLREHPWTTTSVRAILRNPRNAGIAVYKGAEVGRGQWQEIVAEPTWRAVAALLADPGRKPSQGVRSLLGRVALCRCGTYVTGSRGANGQPSYRCHIPARAGREGPHVFTSRAPVDAYVEAATVAWLARPGNAERLAPARGDGAGPLREEAAAIRARLARLGPLFAAGLISEQDMTGGRAAGEARLAQIGARLAEMGRESALAPFAAGRDVRETWAALLPDRRRAVIAAVWEVTLLPSGRGNRVFRTETVRLMPRA